MTQTSQQTSQPTSTSPQTSLQSSPQTSSGPRRRARAYLLLEALVSGAVLAIVLGSSMSLVASARANASYSARRQEAATLARAKIDELSARSALAPTSSALAIVDAAKYPGVKLGFSVTDVTTSFAAKSPQGLLGTLFEIEVTVEYPTRSGPEQLQLHSLRRKR